MVAIRALSKELVGKAKKGTLVCTDIPLVQKLDDENIKINLNGGDRKSEHSLNQSGNITRLISKKNDSDYIFGRLKRDAELGDEKAIEVVEKVKRGEFTSARQVALEMGYRKPVKQKCLPSKENRSWTGICLTNRMGNNYFRTQLT